MSAPLKWFPFEIDAWDTDECVRKMTWAERGVFVALLCWQWREGSVPDDAKAVARALGASCRLVARVLERAFISDGTAERRLVNRKLSEVFVRQQQKSNKAAAAGRASADKRLGRSLARSRIRSEIKTSLSAHAEPREAVVP